MTWMKVIWMKVKGDSEWENKNDIFVMWSYGKT